MEYAILKKENNCLKDCSNIELFFAFVYKIRIIILTWQLKKSTISGELDPAQALHLECSELSL